MTEAHGEMIRLMIDIEKRFNVPGQLRGMLAAAACMESGYNPLARGDWRQRRNRRVPMAIGILQQWPWYERHYEMDRTNPTEAAVAWMQHLRKQLPKVRRRCKIRESNIRKLWVAAWVHSVRAPNPSGRCNETPLHYNLLRRWHRQIRRDQNDGIQYFDIENGWTPEDEFNDDIDGC